MFNQTKYSNEEVLASPRYQHVYVSDQKAFWKNTVAGCLNNARLRINKYRDCLSISPSHDKLYAHPSTKSRLKNISLVVKYFQLIIKAWFQGKTCLLHKNKDKSVEDNLMKYNLPRISGFTFDFHKNYSNQVIYSRKSFSLQE